MLDMEERHAKERKDNLQAAIVDAYLKGAMGEPHPDIPDANLMRIHRAVAARKGLDPQDMLRRTQQRFISQARFEAYYLAEKDGYTHTEIARYFNVHPKGIYYGIQQYQAKFSNK